MGDGTSIGKFNGLTTAGGGVLRDVGALSRNAGSLSRNTGANRQPGHVKFQSRRLKI